MIFIKGPLWVWSNPREHCHMKQQNCGKWTEDWHGFQAVSLVLLPNLFMVSSLLHLPNHILGILDTVKLTDHMFHVRVSLLHQPVLADCSHVDSSMVSACVLLENDSHTVTIHTQYVNRHVYVWSQVHSSWQQVTGSCCSVPTGHMHYTQVHTYPTYLINYY